MGLLCKISEKKKKKMKRRGRICLLVLSWLRWLHHHRRHHRLGSIFSIFFFLYIIFTGAHFQFHFHFHPPHAKMNRSIDSLRPASPSLPWATDSVTSFLESFGRDLSKITALESEMSKLYHYLYAMGPWIAMYKKLFIWRNVTCFWKVRK